MGSVADAPRQGCPITARSEENLHLVAQTFVEKPHSSANRVSKQLSILRRSLHRMMKSLTLRVYRLVLLQELHEPDYPRELLSASGTS